jgi:hypothetical protein
MRATAILVLLLGTSADGQESLDAIRKDIATVAAQGIGSKEGRGAWERLAAAGPEAAPLLVETMDTPSVPRVNWFVTALDRVLDRHGTAKVDVEGLLAFARDGRRQGRARRVALDIVERQRPGTLAKLLPGWLDDPEFRPDAIDLVLDDARKALKAGNKEKAGTQFREAFEHARDIEQARRAAVGLLDLGVEVSVAKHLGFLMDWHLIGPFDAQGQKGFHLSYPPEKGVDLKAEVESRGKTLRWKHYRVEEPSPRVGAKHVALANLRESRALGDADDAVAFAYTEIDVPAARKVEFRGAADDNFTVWVNGKRVFGFEEYRNGVRFDRHRFAVELKAGKNAVLVKVCQTPAPNPEPNWEFLLRVVDEEGRGLAKGR